MYNTYTERFTGDSGTNIMVSVKQQCPNVVSILIIPLQHWYDWKYICFSCLLTAFVSHKMLLSFSCWYSRSNNPQETPSFPKI